MGLEPGTVREFWLGQDTLALEVTLGHLWLVDGKWVGAVGELGCTDI